MKDDDPEASKKGIQVISRAAAVLRSLKEHPDGRSLGQIASDIALPRSTVQRIVGALQDERLIIANTSGSGVRLGPELGALAQAARFNTAELCRPLLMRLTEITGETSDLSVLRDAAMIFVDQVPGTHRLRTVSSVGEVFPILTTANGRSCLAAMPRQTALSLAASEAGASFDADAFSKILDDVQATGLAYDRNEHSDGISAVGFAFTDAAGDLYAISVPVPTTRFASKLSAIEKALLETAKTVNDTIC
ncbi:IclR family transcriptional regulator [Yoonia sp. BS5-3]|uniref:IclR family transcriptional regulator n=1 Tax=Yoonia phaeophyticola TaxID=3137369 RepID=A0ABZ2VAV7_9RHOB